MDNNQVITDDEIARIKKHLRDNAELYYAGGVMFLSGLLIGRKMRKAPKVDQAKVIFDWINKSNADGFSIYALNNKQHRLWSTVYDFAVKYGNAKAISVDEAMEIMIKDYVHAATHL